MSMDERLNNMRQEIDRDIALPADLEQRLLGLCAREKARARRQQWFRWAEVAASFLVLGLIIAIPFLHAKNSTDTRHKGVPSQEASFHQFLMVDEVHGWAAGVNLWRTTDGGSTWTGTLHLPQRNTWTALNADLAWVAATSPGQGGVLVQRTVNGGVDWEATSVSIPGNLTAVSPVSISFATPVLGWLVVEPSSGTRANTGYLFSTTDGGKNWQLVSSTADSLPVAGQIRFLSSTVGWLAGNQGSTTAKHLYRTADAGRTWEEQQLTLPPNRLSEGQIDPGLPVFSTGRVVGFESATWVPASRQPSDYASILYGTDDGGTTWKPSGIYLPLGVVAFHESGRVWIWQADPRNAESTNPVTGSWITTTVGGMTGTRVEVDATLKAAMAEGWNVSAVQFVSEKVGWAMLVKTGSDNRLIQTKDGGLTWLRVH